MAKLPATVTESPTVEKIYGFWAAQPSRQSRRLGASQIGEECERRLWYAFRWCWPSSGQFDGRMLRLFNRGHREEPVFIEELRGIGVKVHSHDPSTGEQFTFSAVGGHFVAKIDGAAQGIVEAPKAWHVLSFKTANTKSWAEIRRDGIAKAAPKYLAQSLVEMRLTGMDRTFLLCVDKNTDSLYGERIRADEAAADRLMEKASRIIQAPEPLPRISEDAAFWKCKGCPARPQCHQGAFSEVSCRTCVHATPEMDGDGRWSCALRKQDLTFAAQQAACPEHRFIPALMPGATVRDASEPENWIEYESPDGFVFRNGPRGPSSYGSRELAALGLAALRDPDLAAVRQRYLPDAQWVGGDEQEAA